MSGDDIIDDTYILTYVLYIHTYSYLYTIVHICGIVYY